ncbi:MAG: 16S rRNA (guanine(527)-N(7))-methyltransferase RsmG [Candidatus Eremiobacteraeota bacterium]|nr:16S rRNA (guanine(527)-N(7))-methyltransferase RsmG [Candidatus Eremiobacteraeota bacterium]
MLEANAHFNLTGAKSQAEIVDHILDSLSLAPLVEAPYADVGSGGGFPLIPVAIVLGIPVTAIESNAKKARFLESLFAPLGVSGTVVTDRAERAAHRPELRERFRSATCRAVGSVSTVAELTLPLLALGGIAILQRGRVHAHERTVLEDASLILGGRLEREQPVAGERRLLVLRKERPTPGRFPRNTGVPQKRPLCG